MSKKKFLAIIDTTESTRRRTLPRGILNTYVIYALDEYDARNILLRQFNQAVLNEVSDAVYIYDIEAMTVPFEQLDAQKASFPGFAFMPWNGSRPPRQSTTPPVSTTSGNQTLSPTVNPQQAPAPVQQPPRPIAPQTHRAPISAAGVSHSPRSREFQSDEANASSTESRVLTPEQRRLIQGVGALSTAEGADEGTNLRVDTSTGTNSRQSTAGYPAPVVKLDQARADLLKGLVPQSGPEIVEDPDLVAEIMEQRGGAPLANAGLDRIEEAPLSDEAIQQMNNELEKFK